MRFSTVIHMGIKHIGVDAPPQIHNNTVGECIKILMQYLNDTPLKRRFQISIATDESEMLKGLAQVRSGAPANPSAMAEAESLLEALLAAPDEGVVE